MLISTGIFPQLVVVHINTFLGKSSRTEYGPQSEYAVHAYGADEANTFKQQYDSSPRWLLLLLSHLSTLRLLFVVVAVFAQRYSAAASAEG